MSRSRTYQYNIDGCIGFINMNNVTHVQYFQSYWTTNSGQDTEKRGEDNIVTVHFSNLHYIPLEYATKKQAMEAMMTMATYCDDAASKNLKPFYLGDEE